jgi:hypothetical protein
MADNDSLFFTDTNGIPENVGVAFRRLGGIGNTYFDVIEEIRIVSDQHYKNQTELRANQSGLFVLMLEGFSSYDINVMKETEVYCNTPYKNPLQKEEMRKRKLIRAKLRRILNDACQKIYPLDYINKSPSARYLPIYKYKYL